MVTNLCQLSRLAFPISVLYSRRRFKYTVLLFSLSSGARSIWNAFLGAYILLLVKDSVHHETDFTCAFFSFIAWLYASIMVSRKAIAAEETLSTERISAFRHPLQLRDTPPEFSPVCRFYVISGECQLILLASLRCHTCQYHIMVAGCPSFHDRPFPNEFQNTSGRKSYINSWGTRVQKWEVIPTRQGNLDLLAMGIRMMTVP